MYRSAISLILAATSFAATAAEDDVGRPQHLVDVLTTDLCPCYPVRGGTYCALNRYEFFVGANAVVEPALLQNQRVVETMRRRFPGVTYEVQIVTPRAGYRPAKDVRIYFQRVGVDLSRAQTRVEEGLSRPVVVVGFKGDWNESPLSTRDTSPLATSERPRCGTLAGSLGVHPDAILIDLQSCEGKDTRCVQDAVRSVDRDVHQAAERGEQALVLLRGDEAPRDNVAQGAVDAALKRWGGIGLVLLHERRVREPVVYLAIVPRVRPSPDSSKADRD